jgi:acyl-coenzyme A synthetase/AMP-(fatty) acid ligase
VDPDDLQAWAHEHLAGYKAPKIVYVADELPRTRNGKLQRQGLEPSIARSRSTHDR